MKPRAVILGGLLLIGLAVGVFVYLSQTNQQPQPPQEERSLTHFSHEATGIGLDYDSKYVQKAALTTQDVEDHLILRLTDKGSTDRPLLFTVRYEDGLAAAATITKQSLIDHLQSSANLTLPKRDNYKLESSKRTQIDGRDALQYIFTYNANENTPTKQQLLIIPLSNDQALYIAQQARTSDYNDLETLVFQPMLNSLVLQR